MLFVSLLSLWLCCSCVHQWPEVKTWRQVVLHVSHQREWTYHHIVIPSTDSRAVSPERHVVRYMIRVFRPGKQTPLASEVYFRDVLEPEDFDITIMVPTGDIEVRAWCDYVETDLRTDHLYMCDDFSAISFTEPYGGGLEEKDAFAGVSYLNVPESIDHDMLIDTDMVMQRPLAAYAFITTDVERFLQSEATRRNIPELATKAESRSRTLEEYKIKVIYAGFYAHVYNHFDDNPVDVKTNVSYEARMTPINDKEALLCFDHVMVNGLESTTPVAIEVYDNEGVKVASINPYTIPIKRSRCTVLRGEFLSAQGSGALGIDPGFDGQYLIEIL